MEVLQQELERAMAALPSVFLQRLISKKLREQGIRQTKQLSQKIAEHILSGSPDPLKHPRKIELIFTADDADELARAIESFCEKHLPQVIPDIAERIAKSVLKTLRSRWASEHLSQEQELSEFRGRLEERWASPLGQLRMMLTMCREWCNETHSRENDPEVRKPEQVRGTLVRMLVRACQVTDEIICLLENGFADGAMARWRTLHEIAVVAAVISRHGESIVERYIAHQAVESKKRSIDTWRVTNSSATSLCRSASKKKS